MAFLQKVLTSVITALFGRLIEWAVDRYKKNQHLEKKRAENADAIEKVKDSKTRQEVDDALDALDDSSFE